MISYHFNTSIDLIYDMSFKDRELMVNILKEINEAKNKGSSGKRTVTVPVGENPPF